MRVIILTVIAGIAGLMAYLMFQGECRGGTVVADAAACRGAGFDAGACNAALAVGHRRAFREYAPIPTQDACSREFPRCAPHEAVSSGFVPVPRAYCIARSASGSLEGAPLYERIGQRIN